jgi:hypothetical protein
VTLLNSLGFSSFETAENTEIRRETKEIPIEVLSLFLRDLGVLGGLEKRFTADGHEKGTPSGVKKFRNRVRMSSSPPF